MTAPRPWTPGPWMTDCARRAMWLDERGKPRPSGAIAVFEATCGIACVAVVVPGCLPAVGNEDAARGNARLIAEAPELYEALAEWLAIRDGVAEAGAMDGPLAQETIDAFAERQRLVVDRARAALARARGEQK